MPAPLAGQLSLTGTAQQLTLPLATCSAFTLKAPVTNQQAVFIGPAGVTTTTGYQLDPGDEFAYERSAQNAAANQYQLQPSDFYAVAGRTGDIVTWLASP